MKPILVSSGEPAGIGPDLCLALAGHALPLVILGDPVVLQARAAQLKHKVEMVPYQLGEQPISSPNHLSVYDIPCPQPVVAGVLNTGAAAYVIQLLTIGAEYCMTKHAAALVTAPVHKGIINQAGIPFVGHTEFFANYTHTKLVVMMLVSAAMRVSLVTTHLPLHAVAATLTSELLGEHLEMVYVTLQQQFGIERPRVKVAGLNPHAGEGGYLGQEEITVMAPVIQAFQQRGLDIQGPFSADTLFLESANSDLFVTMYHDQGLPVLKYASFGAAVNVTCGLPFVRTSVDHGTALDLAGTGCANPDSLLAAVELAANLAYQRTSS